MIKLRRANKEDAEFVVKMILMALHIETKGNDLFIRHMKELVESDETLYHWSRAVIVTDMNKPIGMVLAYDGRDYHRRRLKSFSFVCSDGKPVAEGDNSGLLSQPDESGSGEYYIDSLAVLPEYRGKHIGRMLLTDAIRRGKSLGLTPSILVLPDNLPAVKLYESVGFTGNESLTVFGEQYRKMRVIC